MEIKKDVEAGLNSLGESGPSGPPGAGTIETIVAHDIGEKQPRHVQETVTGSLPGSYVEVPQEPRQISRLTQVRKKSMKAGILGIDNADAIIGSFQATVLVPAITLLLSTGQVLDALLVFAVYAGLQIVKLRLGQGPVISFFASAGKKEIRQKFVSLSKTIPGWK